MNSRLNLNLVLLFLFDNVVEFRLLIFGISLLDILLSACDGVQVRRTETEPRERRLISHRRASRGSDRNRRLQWPPGDRWLRTPSFLLWHSRRTEPSPAEEAQNSLQAQFNQARLKQIPRCQSRYSRFKRGRSCFTRCASVGFYLFLSCENCRPEFCRNHFASRNKKNNKTLQ